MQLLFLWSWDIILTTHSHCKKTVSIVVTIENLLNNEGLKNLMEKLIYLMTQNKIILKNISSKRSKKECF